MSILLTQNFKWKCISIIIFLKKIIYPQSPESRKVGDTNFHHVAFIGQVKSS